MSREATKHSTLADARRENAAAAFKPDIEDAIGRFAQGIRYQTISRTGDERFNLNEFLEFHAHLERSYPNIERELSKKKIGVSSLLYEWPGRDLKRPALMLMAHMDVYPVEDADRSAWECDPFEGKVDSRYLWGRGSWDDKASLFSIMEAVESLIERGWRPERTIFLALGSDEAVGGTRDVVKIADHLRQRKIEIELMMVEGLVVTDGILPGVDRPVALIGIAEKGYLSVELKKVTGPAFASSPPELATTAAGALSLKVNHLLQKNFEPYLNSVVHQMFSAVAPHAKGLLRPVLSNLWLFKKKILKELAKKPTSLATIKTTVSMTSFHCENNDNMLPETAAFVLNIRMLPGESIQDTLVSLSRFIDDDLIEIKTLPGSHEPSPIESVSSKNFALVSESIKSSFPGVLIAPGLMVGATAARHFHDICGNIYRFTPILANQGDLARFHGNNERISIDNFGCAIDFYTNLLLNFEKQIR